MAKLEGRDVYGSLYLQQVVVNQMVFVSRTLLIGRASNQKNKLETGVHKTPMHLPYLPG